MCLSAAGEVARACRAAIPDHFPNVILHEYIIMPDHVHVIIDIVAPAEESTPQSPQVGRGREGLGGLIRARAGKGEGLVRTSNGE